ncbi:MAG TPA: glycosyltransferase [Thermoanaerobaculia bacterium]|nr:glycosyltransferase [Thermoanaerobaculia bacterium]
MRVMLVCPEPLGHGQPAGIGIRFLEIERVLRDDGHDVTLLSRDTGAFDPQTLLRVSGESDVAVVQGHVANDFFAHARPIPTAIDLYDPFIIENLHYFATRGGEVYAHDHATLMHSLARGDFFLCASEAQRHFYLGALLAVGRVNPLKFASDPTLASLIAIAPFGVPPPRDSTHDDAAVLFGGIYDWYDPILAIEAVTLARESVPAMTLTFTTHPNPELTPQGKTAVAMKHAKGLDFVRFAPWVGYAQRGAFYDRFAVALLTFPQSIETDLSMRTRVYDYLWGGLPIVTSSAPGTDELLARYNAGLIVDADSPQAFAHALLAALEQRDRLRDGARRFTADHQWPRVLQPLVDFVRAPRVDAEKEMPERPPSILDRIKRRIGGRA